jgi:Delta24-sterol reductase
MATHPRAKMLSNAFNARMFASCSVHLSAMPLQTSAMATTRRLFSAPSARAALKYRRKEAIIGRMQHFSQDSNNNLLMDRHSRAVQDISASVRGFYEKKEKFRISHGSTNSTRQSAGKGKKMVDTSGLSNVLRVDSVSRTALVEPNVPMDRLVEATLRYGLVPPVVMEFPGITVGGGYAGTSGESSSFKHGFFDSTINQVEMVLANGDVVTCSDHEKPDLFHGAAGAVGSLGVTTLVELQLREAKKYVETTYHPVSSMSEAIEIIEQLTSNPELDYVDGILFSKTQGAIISGRLTDHPQNYIPVQRFSDAKDPWFYLHVKDKITKTTGPVVEAIPLAEYLFRYDRGGFWVGASAFDYFNMPFNDFTRWWLDDFLHTRMMYTALHASGQSKKYVVQDLALPYSAAESFVDYTDKRFGIYPLWLCPLKQSPHPTMHPHAHETEADGRTLKPMLNIGLWGYGPPRHDDFVKANRDLEQKLRELGGMKWLYAQTYYTEKEFWEMYDKEWYDALREKYDATSLPSVYDKVKVEMDGLQELHGSSLGKTILQTWPISGFYGIKKAIDSGAYLQARSSAWKSRTEPKGVVLGR